MADKTTPAKKAPLETSTAEIKKRFDEDQEKGYRGVKVDPLPNSAYSLESGPDSPSPANDSTRLEQVAATEEEK